MCETRWRFVLQPGSTSNVPRIVPNCRVSGILAIMLIAAVASVGFPGAVDSTRDGDTRLFIGEAIYSLGAAWADVQGVWAA